MEPKRSTMSLCKFSRLSIFSSSRSLMKSFMLFAISSFAFLHRAAIWRTIVVASLFRWLRKKLCHVKGRLLNSNVFVNLRSLKHRRRWDVLNPFLQHIESSKTFGSGEHESSTSYAQHKFLLTRIHKRLCWEGQRREEAQVENMKHSLAVCKSLYAHHSWVDSETKQTTRHESQWGVYDLKSDCIKKNPS